MLMAMKSSNAAPEKVQQQQYQYWPSQQVQMDERDGFILWLRGEFAAANAIINALCHHLKEVGEPGEYDGVIGCVEQRRCNWSPVLHMQQYFSVNDVVYALQQVGVRKPRREVKVGPRYNKQMSDEARATNGSSNVKTDTQSDSIPDRKQVLTAVPKTFVSNEICDGKMVNVTDGLRLYEELFDQSMVSKLIAGANDLRAAGRRGQLLAKWTMQPSRLCKTFKRDNKKRLKERNSDIQFKGFGNMRRISYYESKPNRISQICSNVFFETLCIENILQYLILLEH